jgi:hypothetical protein
MCRLCDLLSQFLEESIARGVNKCAYWGLEVFCYDGLTYIYTHKDLPSLSFN